MHRVIHIYKQTISIVTRGGHLIVLKMCDKRGLEKWITCCRLYTIVCYGAVHIIFKHYGVVKQKQSYCEVRLYRGDCPRDVRRLANGLCIHETFTYTYI